MPRPPADSASVSRHRQGRGTAQTDGDGCQGLPPCTCPGARPRPSLPGPGHTRAAAPSATAWTLGSRDPGPGAGVIAPVGTVQARIPETEQNSTGVPDTPSSGPLSPPQAWGRVGEAPGGRTGRVGCGGRPGLGLHMRTGEASRGLASRQSRGQGFSLTGGPSSTLPDPAAGGVLGVVGLGQKMAGCRVRLTASARGPRCSGGPSRPGCGREEGGGGELFSLRTRFPTRGSKAMRPLPHPDRARGDSSAPPKQVRSPGTTEGEPGVTQAQGLAAESLTPARRRRGRQGPEQVALRPAPQGRPAHGPAEPRAAPAPTPGNPT